MRKPVGAWILSGSLRHRPILELQFWISPKAIRLREWVSFWCNEYHACGVAKPPIR
jgi:hypothetical protein